MWFHFATGNFHERASVADGEISEALRCGDNKKPAM
jgi:hypothetical protein